MGEDYFYIYGSRNELDRLTNRRARAIGQIFSEAEPIKSKPNLFPPKALQLAGEVLAFGETKHPDEKWKRMTADDHIAAAIRHYLSHQCGEKIDKESGKPHLVHCLVRIAMAVECEYSRND